MTALFAETALLPEGFADCLVTIDRQGDELRIRKVKRLVAGRYSFKEMIAKVTPDTIHGEVDFGPPVGGEQL